MGFWSTLGKWAPLIGGVAATPFTGGASLLTTMGLGAKTAGAIGAGLGVAGKLASGASAQRAQDRGAQGEYDLARVGIENAQALQQAQAKRDAETQRRGQMVGLDMTENFRPSTDPRAQKFQTGGPMVNPETIKLMRERTLNAFNTGSDVPSMTRMPEQPGGGPTGMDSVLNALSLGSTAVGGLREAGLLGGGSPQVAKPAPYGNIGQVQFPNERVEDDIPWWSPLAQRGN